MIQPDAPPMLQVYNTCRHFIRTIPALQVDELNVEDVDTEMEDHCYDEAALFAMARPISLQPAKPRKSSYDRRLDELESPVPMDDYEGEAIFDHLAAMEQIGGDYVSTVGEDITEVNEYDDGQLHSTVE
jgi:hypothetical protein